MIRDFDGMREHISQGSRKDTTLTIVPSDFLISVNDCETMTTPELNTYINRQKKRGIGNIQTFQIEYHKRFATIMAEPLDCTSLHAACFKQGNGPADRPVCKS